MASSEQQFLQYWSSHGVRVALWTDSTYYALQETDMLKLAHEMDFPLATFTCSYDAGLTVVGCDNHAGNATPKPADVVIIEMGYNDDSNLAENKVAFKMRKQTWYRVLAESTSIVKFVIFIHEPTYRQVCPPASKKQMKKWMKGTTVEGSKYTDEAMELCQELGIPALCLKASSAEELYEGMLTTDESGVVWQTEGACRSYTSEGNSFTADGQIALWEDSDHPTAAGAAVHFRCVVKAFKARCANGGFTGPKSSKAIPSTDMSAAWMNQAWNWQPVSSWQSNGYARSQPYW